MAGSVHLFKLHDMLIKENLMLKKKLDLGCFRDILDRHVHITEQ